MRATLISDKDLKIINRVILPSFLPSFWKVDVLRHAIFDNMNDAKN